MIHIVNGDVLADKINHLKGDIIVWREMYDFGPLEEHLTEPFLNKRAQYFENLIDVPKQLFIKNSMKQEEELNRIKSNGDITLWFEHDRYDQMMLIYILSRLNGKSFKSLNMISINSHSSVNPFLSLGQLSVEDLNKLYENERRKVTRQQLLEASLAWKYYTIEDPVPLHNMLCNEEVSLPYLKKAIEVHFSYFPHPRDGLNQLERGVLKLLEQNSLSFNELFQLVNKERINDGLTDLQFSAILNRLLPLIRVSDRLPRFNDNSDPHCSITDKGKLVLEVGSLKRPDISTIDWWVGGVHLTDNGWYYDGEKLIKNPNQY